MAQRNRTIESQIKRVQAAMLRTQDKYKKLTAQLQDLEEQKRQADASVVLEAYIKSGKSLDEIMAFLNT